MGINKIFKFYNTNPMNKIRLFVFPYAGGGASAFKEWGNHLSPEIELCSLQFPGREERFYEKPHCHIDTLFQELIENFYDYLEIPFVFLGHSLGALLCFEFSRFLETNNIRLPLHVYLSGSNPPVKNLFKDFLGEMDDAQIIDKLKSFNGTPKNIINNKELMKLFLPMIKADLAIMNSFDYKNDYQFSMPITVFGGISDPLVECGSLGGWNNFTKAYCRVITFPGDHFFIFSEMNNILDYMNRELRFLSAVSLIK